MNFHDRQSARSALRRRRGSGRTGQESVDLRLPSLWLPWKLESKSDRRQNMWAERERAKLPIYAKANSLYYNRSITSQLTDLSIASLSQRLSAHAPTSFSAWSLLSVPLRRFCSQFFRKTKWTLDPVDLAYYIPAFRFQTITAPSRNSNLTLDLARLAVSMLVRILRATYA
jgi:hypothetical protein